ncbi:MAG: DUF4403 family protein, partial [Vulcanimicrobiaceae bacterium]
FPPAPPRATSFPATGNAQPSVVVIPVSVRVRNVQQALNRSGSSLLDSGWRAAQASSSDGFAGVRAVIAQYLNEKAVGAGLVPTQFRLTVSRGPAAASASGSGGALRIGFNDRYQLELRSPAGGYVCSPRTSAALRSAAAIAATVSPDGKIHTSVSEFARRLTARCSAANSLLRDREIDLTPAIQGTYSRALNKVSDVLARVLQRAADLALRVKFATLATTFAQPLQITPTTWLTPNLQNAAVRQLAFAANGGDLLANFNVALAMAPQISFGSQPTASPVWPPSFSALEIPDGFHLPVDVRVPFDLITQRARAQLNGTELPVKFIGTVRIDDVQIYATDSGTADAPHPQLVIEIDFSGSASGKLYLWGTPAIDPATRVISMPDLTYTTDTRKFFVRFFAPVLMSNFVLSRVRRAATFDASELIDAQTAPYMKPYDRTVKLTDGTVATLHAVPSPLGLNGISVDADALYVHAVINGTVNANVDTSVNALALLSQGR